MAAAPGESDAEQVERLLAAWREGDAGAGDRLFPLVYREIHALAHRLMRRESRQITLTTTALVHEAYLKLVDQTRADFRDRGHFLGVASRAMRQVLVDRARRRNALKRGGGAVLATFDESRLAAADDAERILAVDAALSALEALDVRASRIVELRVFGGLSVEEIAALLELSPRTIKREWRKARAFLHLELRGEAEAGGSASEP